MYRGDIYDFVSIGNRLIAAAAGKVWYRDVPDVSDFWENTATNIVKLFVDGTDVLGSGPNGEMYLSSDAGVSWSAYSGGDLPDAASGFVRKGNKVFASVPGFGVYVSFSGGGWINRSTGLTSLDCIGIAELGGKIYIATSDDWVWKTSDNGNSWSQVIQPGKSSFPLNTIHSLNGFLFAGGANGIYRNSGGSNSWDILINGLSNAKIDWVAALDNRVVGISNIGSFVMGSSYREAWAYFSENPWKMWKNEEVIRGDGRLFDFQQQGGFIFMKTVDIDETGILFDYHITGNDAGYTLNPDDPDFCSYDDNFGAIAVIGEYLFYASNSPVLRIGISPTKGCTGGPPDFSFSTSLGHAVNSFDVESTVLIAYTTNGIYLSGDSAQSWQAAGLQGFHVKNLIKANDFQIANTTSGALRYSETNPGLGWVPIPESPDLWMKNVLYREAGGQVRYSTDDGDSWQDLTNDPDMGMITSISAEGNDQLLVGTADRGIWSHPLINTNPARQAAPDTEIAGALRVFPNPTSDVVFVKSGSKGRLDLLGLNGTVMHSESVDGSRQVLSLRKFAAGVYVLRLTTAEGVQVQKIVKQ